MDRNRIMFRLFFSSVLLISAVGVAQAEMFKWVDSKGVVHYTSAPPPESAIHDREILGSQGQTLKKIRGKLTEKEKIEEARRIAEKEEKARIEAAAKKRDRNLLISYQTIEGIERKRDAKLLYLDDLIKDQVRYRETAKEEYEELLREAIQVEREGKTPPEDLKASLRSAKREFEINDSELIKARVGREQAASNFDADIKRFKELKGIE